MEIFRSVGQECASSIHPRQDPPARPYGLRPLGTGFVIHVMPGAIFLLCTFIPDEA